MVTTVLMMAVTSLLAAFVTAGTMAGTISMGAALDTGAFRGVAAEEAFMAEDTAVEGIEVATGVKLKMKIICYTQLRSYC